MKLVKEIQRTYWKYLTFNASDSFQEFTVPNNVTELNVDCVASKGTTSSGDGGKGGRVQCILNATPGQTLYITVGKTGSSQNTAVYNAADIRTNNAGITDTTSLNSRLIVAGGGGSGAISNGSQGGAGGGLTGGTGGNAGGHAGTGKGGTQTAGGAAASAEAFATNGAKGSFGLGGGGGGGGGAGGAGWYGGGGGSKHDYAGVTRSGGGGGSSYTHPDLCMDVTHTQGYQDGEGYIRIDYISDSSDYDYTEDETVCYAIKEEEIELVPNVTVVGSPTINNGLVSGFSTSNYLLVDNKYRSNNNGEYIVKFTTGTNVSTMQRVLHCEYFLCFQFESGRFMGYNWQRGDRTYLINCLANTTYWFKFIANGTSRTYAYSLDGSNWTTILTETDTSMNPSSSYRLTLGTSSKDHSGPFLGSIDLNESYIKINGETWWTGMREEVKYTYKGVK